MIPSRRQLPLACAATLAAAVILAPSAGLARGGDARGFSHGFDDGGEDAARFSFAIVGPGERTFSEMSDFDDRDDLEGLINDSRDELFWFRLDDRHYVVRDRKWIDRADEITRPIREIG